MNHKPLIMIDDLRSIGHLACQASHATEQLYKLYFENLSHTEEFKLAEDRCFSLNYERRLQQAEFLDANGIAKNTQDGGEVKGNYKVYCQAKHAIVIWVLAEEKFLGCPVARHTPLTEPDPVQLREYNQAQSRLFKAYANMLSTVAAWLGVEELTVCADCLADKLEI